MDTPLLQIRSLVPHLVYRQGGHEIYTRTHVLNLMSSASWCWRCNLLKWVEWSGWARYRSSKFGDESWSDLSYFPNDELKYWSDWCLDQTRQLVLVFGGIWIAQWLLKWWWVSEKSMLHTNKQADKRWFFIKLLYQQDDTSTSSYFAFKQDNHQASIRRPRCQHWRPNPEWASRAILRASCFPGELIEDHMLGRSYKLVRKCSTK